VYMCATVSMTLGPGRRIITAVATTNGTERNAR
jgi:hypothetical protein